MIRRMEFCDIDQIKEIDKLCFNTKASRNSDGIKGYIEAGNNSSIVYESNGKVIGYNFIHIWGSFAWFGPLGVHPDYQGKEIGKALINHTIKILKDDYKISTIGLNTMPESSYNVGFYMQLGFRPLKLSLSLGKSINCQDDLPDSSPYSVDEIGSDESVVKNTLKLLSNKIFTNFDLNSELHMLKNMDFGTVFVLKDNRDIHGIVICYTKSIREMPSKNLHIKLAIVDNTVNQEKALDSIISTCTNYAKNIDYESITIDCNTYNSEICSYLISKHNFKIQRTFVMMLMGENNPFNSRGAILLTRLAG